MKIPIRSQFTRASHFIWHCLWVTLLFVLFQGGIALAVPVNIPDPPGPNPDHTINATVGQPIVGENIGTNASGDVFWAFAANPACPILTTPPDPDDHTPLSFDCNGVTITLPESSPAAVSKTAETTVSGSPTAPGNFSFRLVVTSEDDGTQSGERIFNLNIREPFDLSFVLDRSISMNRSADPDDPSSLSRWEALRTAVRESITLASFINDLIAIPAPDGSRLGLTVFGDGVLAESFATPQPIDEDLLDLVETAIATSPTSPTGDYTRMGPGLQDAEAKLDNCSRNRLIILFTDGEQNPVGDPNLVADDGTTYMSGDPINATCPASNPANNPIEIVSVGILQPSSTYADLLQALASANGGNSAIFTTTGLDFSFQDGSAVTFETALTQAIVQALSGSSPQIVAQYQNILDGEITLTPFNLNQNVRQLILKLTFEQELPRSELAQLLANIRVLKDNDDVTDVTDYFEPTIVGDSAKTIWLRSRFPSSPSHSSGLSPLASEGSYQVQLSQPSSIADALSFRLVSIADDSFLDMSWQTTPDTPRTNQTFSPTVELNWLGQPISNANVEAWILKPGDDLGDLLAKTPDRVDPCLACLQDAGSAGYQKYLDLLRNDPEFVNRLKPNEQKITLNYQGDGVYSTAYNPGDISGVYQVLYRVIAEDPSFGTIQRQAIQSVYVRFGEIDLAASSETTFVDGNKTLVYWRPITIDGRLIGPGQSSAISIDGIDVVDIEDNQDGSYTLTLSGDPKTPILVKVLGEKVYNGQADQFGPSQNWPLWLIILIVVLVLLLLVLLIWFLSRGESESESESNGDS